MKKIDIVRYRPGMQIAPEREVNVLCGRWEPKDILDFFGPVASDTDLFLVVPRGTTWGEIFVAMGLFDSRAEAARGGWDQELETGFDAFRAGDPSRWVTSLYRTD